MISGLVAATHILIGMVFLSVVFMIVHDLRVGWKERGPSHFGFAWIAMAMTCGGHHLEHGLHVALTDTVGGPLDAAVAAIGLPAGLVWVLLRIEAMTGGRGDRALGAMPRWVEMLPTLAAVYLAAVVTATFGVLQAREASFDVRLLPNLALVVVYMAVGVILLRTQVYNHRITGTWSLSGVCLTIVFPTCSVMHAVWAMHAATGQYLFDAHLLAIDTLGVPAALYFLWVVWSLSHGRIVDWNLGVRDMRRAEEHHDDPVTARR